MSDKKDYFYKALDWKQYETIMMVEGPSTPLMLHIAAIQLTIKKIDVTYDDIKDLYPFVTHNWPDKKLFDHIWPEIRESIKDGNARTAASRANGELGGRPPKPKHEAGTNRSDKDYIKEIANICECFKKGKHREVKKSEEEAILKFLEEQNDPMKIIAKFATYIMWFEDKANKFPKSFYNWLLEKEGYELEGVPVVTKSNDIFKDEPTIVDVFDTAVPTKNSFVDDDIDDDSFS